jgi:hypothetical protein
MRGESRVDTIPDSLAVRQKVIEVEADRSALVIAASEVIGRESDSARLCGSEIQSLS